MIDPFGLKQEDSSPLPDPDPSSSEGSSRRLWAVLLLLDTVFIFIFGTAAAYLYLGEGGASLLESWLEPAPPARAIPNRRHPLPKPAPPATSSGTVANIPPAVKPETTPSEPRKAKPVEFVCEAPEARRVYLKGGFMRRGKQRMKKGEDGKWHLTLYLMPETYKYYCLINGKDVDTDALTLEVTP